MICLGPCLISSRHRVIYHCILVWTLQNVDLFYPYVIAPKQYNLNQVFCQNCTLDWSIIRCLDLNQNNKAGANCTWNISDLSHPYVGPKTIQFESGFCENCTLDWSIIRCLDLNQNNKAGCELWNISDLSHPCSRIVSKHVLDASSSHDISCPIYSRNRGIYHCIILSILQITNRQ